MDKFGLSRVSRGPPGPPGRDAFDLHLWCPEALLQLFRESEVCTYFFNTAADGLITQGGKPVGLRDRYGNEHGHLYIRPYMSHYPCSAIRAITHGG